MATFSRTNLLHPIELSVQVVVTSWQHESGDRAVPDPWRVGQASRSERFTKSHPGATPRAISLSVLYSTRPLHTLPSGEGIQTEMTAFKIRHALLAAATVTAVAAIVPGSASAKDSTWTVSPGGNVTATSTGFVYAVDDQTTQEVDCDSADGTATLPSGSGLPGTNIVTVNSINFTNCVGPASVTEAITVNGLPLHLNADSYSGGVTTGHIDGVTAQLDGADQCHATFGGPGSTGATLAGTYDNGTGTLSLGAGNLTVKTVNSFCPSNWINVGDTVTLHADLTVSPAQTITSP